MQSRHLLVSHKPFDFPIKQSEQHVIESPERRDKPHGSHRPGLCRRSPHDHHRHPERASQGRRRQARQNQQILAPDGASATAGNETRVDAAVPADTSTTTPPAKRDKAPRITKSASVIALLQRTQGATIAEMIEATGWLPHTTRAALTGIRKKGHIIEKSKRGDMTCYRIAPVAA